MIGFIIVGILILLIVVTVQIGKITDLASVIRGEEITQRKITESQARWLLVFLVSFLVIVIWSSLYYKNVMLGYGPHQSASEHGGEIDSLFNTTLLFTGIVFILTHIALFWFTFKYRRREGTKATFFAHNTQLELIWTGVPAVVMVLLVINGLVVWNNVMYDVEPGEEYVELEATGYQFAWDLRYPGADGKLGTKNYQLINGANNPLGQDWTDRANIDDFHATEIYLPVGKKVRVQITAKDVLHNFYLPHFRLKMDAVPGMPTYFVFTPTTTTEEYRQRLSEYPEWQVPADPSDPEGPQRWELFDYELACAELCGNGHYSMRRIVKIVSEEEFNKWFNEQRSYFALNIRNTDADPYIGELLPYEIVERGKELISEFESAYVLDDPSSVAINLKNVFYNIGSAELRDLSKHELDNVASIMNQYEDVTIEISGHTDNTGDPRSNMVLSDARATSVVNYLVSKGIDAQRLRAIGYGQNRPADTNDTAEGRQNNRRIEMRIL